MPPVSRAVYVVVADSEPLLEARRGLAETHPDRIVAGLDLARAAAGAARAAVLVRADWDAAARALRRALPAEVPVVRVPAVVGCDDADAIERRHAQPFEAVAAVPVEAVAIGEPLVEVRGAVTRPGVYARAASVADQVAAAGGATESAWVAMAGGAAGGRLTYADEQMNARALVVLPVEHGVVRRALLSAEDARRRAAAVCSRCGICTELCPRALEGAPLAPHLGLGKDACSGCGVCAAVCPIALDPRLLLAGPAPARAPHPERAARGLAVSRLGELLDLARYA